VLLFDVAVGKTRSRKHAARLRRGTSEPPCATPSRRTACVRRTRSPFSEPTLTRDPAGLPGVFPTATDATSTGATDGGTGVGRAIRSGVRCCRESSAPSGMDGGGDLGVVDALQIDHEVTPRLVCPNWRWMTLSGTPSWASATACAWRSRWGAKRRLTPAFEATRRSSSRAASLVRSRPDLEATPGPKRRPAVLVLTRRPLLGVERELQGGPLRGLSSRVCGPRASWPPPPSGVG
jgi:hypothetical protein